MDDDSQRTTFDATFPRKEFYEFSNKIMVAAIISLSVVTLFMCLLHLYARSVIRQRDRSTLAARALALQVAYANSEQPELHKVGLDPSVIDTIPLFVYRARGNEDEPMMECLICRSIFEDGETARVRSGSFEMVTIRRAKSGRSASMSFLKGTSDVWSSTGATNGKATTGGSSMRFGPIRRILSWERLSLRTQSNSHEDGTDENQ